MEKVAFERFDKFLKAAFDTRSGVQVIYQFKNKYRVSVSLGPFYLVDVSKMGLWKIELLGRVGTTNGKKMEKKEEYEWLKKQFSIETDSDSDFFIWYLPEEKAEIILEEIKNIREPFWFKLKTFFN